MGWSLLVTVPSSSGEAEKKQESKKFMRFEKENLC
jgi:hypothetical protein